LQTNDDGRFEEYVQGRFKHVRNDDAKDHWKCVIWISQNAI